MKFKKKCEKEIEENESRKKEIKIFRFHSSIDRHPNVIEEWKKKRKKEKENRVERKNVWMRSPIVQFFGFFFSCFAFFRWQTIIKKTHQHLHLIHTSVEVDVSYTFFNSFYFTIIIIFIISSSSICILSIDIFIRFQFFVWSSYTKRTTNTTNKDWIERKQWQKTEWRYCTHRVVKKIKRLFSSLSLSPFLSFPIECLFDIRATTIFVFYRRKP